MPNSLLDAAKWPFNTLAGYLDPMTPARTREPTRKWLTGPVAKDDMYGEPLNDASSLATVLNSLVPSPWKSEEENIAGTVGIMLPGGGVRAARDLARGPVPQSVINAIGGGAGRRNAMRLFPLDIHHGTNTAFDVIDPNRLGSNKFGDWIYTEMSKLGTWGAHDRPGAQNYAEHAVKQKGGKPVVMDWKVRTKGDSARGVPDVRHGELTFDPKHFEPHGFLGTMEDARDAGYQVFTARNVPFDFKRGSKGADITVVFKGNEFLIRNKDARFDWKKLAESGLKLGLGGLTFGGFVEDAARDGGS